MACLSSGLKWAPDARPGGAFDANQGRLMKRNGVTWCSSYHHSCHLHCLAALHLCCIILVLSHAHRLLSHIIWYEIQYFWTNLYQGCFFAGIGSFISGWSWLLSDGMKVQKAGVIIAKQSIIPTLLLGTSCATLQFCSTAPVISFGFKAAERVWNAEQWSAAKRQWYQFLLTCNDNPSFF